MSESPEGLRTRRTLQAIHDARDQAAMSFKRLKAAMTAGDSGQKQTASAACHASVIDYFRVLSPMIKEKEPELMNDYIFGHIEFPKSNQVLTVKGFNQFTTLDNPVSIKYKDEHHGMLGIRYNEETESKPIPPNIFLNTFQRLDQFAHNNDLLMGENDERPSGEY